MPTDEAPDVAWSVAVDEAAWIAPRLAPFEDCTAGSVVPTGFAAYARLLHPVHDTTGRRVRWSEVAAWSGRSMRPGDDFHAVAFPEAPSTAPRPWRGQGPRSGTLDSDDAAALVAILRRHTSTPDACWFCLWDGYGWMSGGAVFARTGGGPAEPRPPVVPAAVLDGPTVDLPYRSYLLYSGPVEAALAFVESEGQTPNLFWPSDRSWCVATEIDLSSTYVGGTAELVASLLASDDLEAVGAEPFARHGSVDDWICSEAESAARDLLASGHATVVTTAGTVEATLVRHGLLRRRVALATRVRRPDGEGSSYGPVGSARDPALQDDIESRLIRVIVDLVE